jgi:hypothetical protein
MPSDTAWFILIIVVAFCAFMAGVVITDHDWQARGVAEYHRGFNEGYENAHFNVCNQARHGWGDFACAGVPEVMVIS